MMLCVVCGKEDDGVVKYPRVPKSAVLDLLKEWSSLGKFVDSYQRSCRDLNWSWHRTCHSRISLAELKRVRVQQENATAADTAVPFESSTPEHAIPEQPCTSSSSSSRLPRRLVPVIKNLCFFCHEGDKGDNNRIDRSCETVSRISTLESVEKLKRAVRESGNQEWMVQLPDDLDVLAADIFYHKTCWSNHVHNRQREFRQSEVDGGVVQVAEFTGALRNTLENGAVMSIKEIEQEQKTYGLNYPRWRLKDFLRQHIMGVEFTKSRNPREPDMVHLPKARQIAMKNQSSREALKLAALFDAAKIIREEVLCSDEWKFEGDASKFTLPPLVEIFSSWIVGGPGTTENPRVRQSASIIGQVLVGHILSRKQTFNTVPLRTRVRARTTPLQISTAVAVHQETRNKSLVNFLHGSGLSISYGHLLRLETALAHAVLKAGMTDGAFISRRLRKGTLVHFAIDNVDFQEDTIDGKNTLHATITVAFQPGTNQGEDLEPLKVDCSEVGTLRASIYNITPYRVERKKQILAATTEEDLNMTKGASNMGSDILMLLAAGFAALEAIPRSLPVWSAFNSRLSKETTCVPNSIICPLPLLDAPAPECSSLLTMMLEMEKIQRALNGDGAPVLVAADMTLYSKLLEMKLALKKENWVVRVGDLHVVIAMLRCLGVHVEGSGLDQVFSESSVYGPATVRQILAGSHVNRGVEAHTILASALLALKWTGSRERAPDAETLLRISRDADEKVFQDVLETLGDGLENLVAGKASQMDQFCSTYIKMVLLLLNYIRAVRVGDWLLHLRTLREFTPFFFALNRSSYARFIPVYVSMMLALKTESPRIWNYLSESWVIRKSQIPFTAIGCDHALEQVNRMLKGEGGLIGITRNPSARTKFFLIQDELLRMKQETHCAAKNYTESHHRDNCSTTATNHAMTEKVLDILKTNNPYATESEALVTVLSNKVIPTDIASGILKTEDSGRIAMLKYQEERIINPTLSPWDVLHRLPTKTFRDAYKKARVTIDGKQVAMAGTEDFTRRLLLAAQRNDNLDLRDIISTYELSLFPLSLFDEQGDPRVTAKSALLRVFEGMNERSNESPCKEILVVDAMAQLQALQVGGAKNFKELAVLFLEHISRLSSGYGLLHLIFDRYDLGSSLKDRTRAIRVKGRSCELQITSETRIPGGTTMSRILSTNSNKNSFIELIIEESKHHSWVLDVVCWWKDKVSAAKGGQSESLSCAHEEADTKIIYCLSKLPRDKEVMVLSPDTDVLVLLLRHLPKLPPKTQLRLGKTTFNISTIREKLGQRADALTSFHGLTGCDTVESFFKKGKIAAWNAFLKAGEDVLVALLALQEETALTLQEKTKVCEFVSSIYGFKNSSLEDARWLSLQKKKVPPSDAPPTVAAAVQHILRAQRQIVIWEKALEPGMTFPCLTSFGFQDDGRPILSTLPPAPQEIMETLKCSCKGDCDTGRCRCQRRGQSCSELCDCPGSCLNDESKVGETSDEDESDFDT